jgi:hypothetical protein
MGRSINSLSALAPLAQLQHGLDDAHTGARSLPVRLSTGKNFSVDACRDGLAGNRLFCVRPCALQAREEISMRKVALALAAFCVVGITMPFAALADTVVVHKHHHHVIVVHHHHHKPVVVKHHD